MINISPDLINWVLVFTVVFKSLGYPLILKLTPKTPSPAFFPTSISPNKGIKPIALLIVYPTNFKIGTFIIAPPIPIKEDIKPTPVHDPELVVLNEELAKELNLDFSKIDKKKLVSVLVYSMPIFKSIY